MKIGVIIPDRGDRPRFMEHCNYLLSEQILQPDEIYRVNEAPRSDAIDITYRYRKGYDYFRNKGFDVLFLWESDDFYAPNYISSMLAAWIDAGSPDLFGQRNTEYYHIREFSHFTFRHEQRSSAMSTMIKPDLTFDWPPDNEPYLDVWLFERLKYKLWLPEPIISLGIKHGDGLCGGKCHGEDMEMYTKYGRSDVDRKFLRSIVDPVSFKFYSNYFANYPPNEYL